MNKRVPILLRNQPRAHARTWESYAFFVQVTSKANVRVSLDYLFPTGLFEPICFLLGLGRSNYGPNIANIYIFFTFVLLTCVVINFFCQECIVIIVKVLLWCSRLIGKRHGFFFW